MGCEFFCKDDRRVTEELHGGCTLLRTQDSGLSPIIKINSNE